MKQNKKNLIKKIMLIVGIILIIVALALLIHFLINKYNQSKYYNENQDEVTTYLENFDETNDLYVDDEIIENTTEETDNDTVVIGNTTSSLLGVLEISKINLKVGFYDLDSSKNTVNYGIELLSNSVMPDETGQVIIAGHSGSGKLAYFKNLYKLEAGDEVTIYYNNKTYTYTLAYSEDQDKDGTLSIYRNSIYRLVLITCTYNNHSSQTIYYFTLNS